MQLGLPCELKPGADVVLRPGLIRGDKEAFVLCKDLGAKMWVDGVGAVHESIGDGSAPWKEV